MSFWCLHILPKNELKQVNLLFIVVKSNCFVHFLEELRIPKSPFEINWPLPAWTCFQNLSWIHIHRTLLFEKLQDVQNCKMVLLVHGWVRCGFGGLGHNMMSNDILCNKDGHWNFSKGQLKHRSSKEDTKVWRNILAAFTFA